MKKVPLSNNGQSEWLKVDWGTYESIITSTDFNNLPKNRTKNATVTGRYSSHDEAQADFVKKDYKRADESMYDYFIRVYGQKTGQKIYNEWTIRQTSKNIDPRKDHISKIKDWWDRVRTKTKIEVKDVANIQRWYLFPPKQSRVYGPEVAPETPMWVKMNRYTLHRLQDLDRYMFTRDPYHANIPIEEVELNKAGEVVSYKVRGKKVDLSKVSDKNLKAIANSDLIRGPKNKIESINMQDQWTRLQRVVFDKKDKSGDQWRKRISIFERIQSAQWAPRQQISWTRAYRQNYTKNLLREWAADPNKLEDHWSSLFSKNQLHSMRTPYEKARAQYNMEGGFYRSNDYYSMIVHDDISKESKRRIAKSYMAAHLSMELGFKVSPKAISTKQADDELRKNNPGLQADIDIEKQAIRYNLNHIEGTRDIALVNTLALHPLQRARNLNKIDYSQYYSGNAPYKQFFKEAPKGFHVPKAISRRDITFSEFRMARDLFVKERSKELIKEYTGEAKAQRAQESIKLFEDKIKDLEKQREARLEGLRLTVKSRKGDVNKLSQLVEDDDTLKTIARKLTMAQKDLDEARATVEELRARIRPERKGDYTRAKFGAEDDWKKELKYSKQHGGSLGRLPNLVKSTITGTKNYSRPIVVYDVETGPQEEILSVSAAKFVIDKKTNKLVKVDTFNRFYYPIITDKSAWNNEAVRVNGLTPDVIRSYRHHDHAKYSRRYDAGEMNALLKFIGDGSVLVGQNSHDFDNMKAFRGHLPGIDTVDTMDVARGFRGTNIGDVDEKEWRVKNDLESLVRWADWERTGRHGSDGGKGRTMKELGFSHHLSEHDIVATAFVFETMVNMKNEAGNALRFVLNNPGHNFGPYDSMVKSLIYKGAYKRTPEPGSYIDRRFYNMKTSDNDVGGPIDILPDMDMNDENTQVFDVDAQGNRKTDSFQKTGLSEKALDKLGEAIGIGSTDSEKVADALTRNYNESKIVESMETISNLLHDYLGAIAVAKGGSSDEFSTEADSAVKFTKKIQNLRGRGLFTDEDLSQLLKIDSKYINPDYALSQAVAGVKAADTLAKKQIKSDTVFDDMIDQARDESFGEFHSEWADRIAQRGIFFGQGDRYAEQQYFDNLASKYSDDLFYRSSDKFPYRDSDVEAQRSYNIWEAQQNDKRVQEALKKRTEREIYYNNLYNMGSETEKRRNEKQAEEQARVQSILDLGSKYSDDLFYRSSDKFPYRDSDVEAQRSYNIWEAQQNDKRVQKSLKKRAEREIYYNNLYNMGSETEKRRNEKQAEEQAKKRTEQWQYYNKIYGMADEVKERRDKERFKSISSFAEELSADTSHDPRAKYLERFERAEKNIPGSHTAYANSVWDEFNKSIKEANENMNDFGDSLSGLSEAIAEFTPDKSQFYDPRITSEAAEKGYMSAFGAADFLPRSLQKNLLRLGDAGFRQLQIKQSAFGTYLDIARASGVGMQNTMKKVGGAVGEIAGNAIGGPALGAVGKQGGEAIGSLTGWGVNLVSQIKGRMQKRQVENAFANMQSTFDLMSMAKDYMVAPFKILGAAAKTLTSVFKNLSVSVVNFMGSSLQDMGKMGTPLTTMTGVNYTKYQGLGALDSLFGFSKGTLNSSFESTAQQAQLLYSTGQFNQERLIASARLGVFGQTYGRNASFEGIVNGLMSRPVTEERMALASQIDSSLPVIMETMKALGISTWEQYKNPALQGIGWHAINDEERLGMRKSYYEYSAIQENIGNTKKRAGQWLWSKGGKDIMNGVNEALDIIVSGGDWKQAWLKLKTPIIKVWDKIKDFFGVSFSNTDTLWQKIKKFGKAVWDKIADSLGIESNGKNPVDVLKDAFETFIESIAPIMLKGILMIEELWTAAFQSIITSVSPILDEFFNMISRIRIDPLAMLSDKELILFGGRSAHPKVVTIADPVAEGAMTKSTPTIVVPTWESTVTPSGREEYYSHEKAVKLSQKGFDTVDDYLTKALTSIYYQKRQGIVWLEAGKRKLTAINGTPYNSVETLKYQNYIFNDSNGRIYTWAYREGESVEEFIERAKQSDEYARALKFLDTSNSHIFSENIAPGLITATNYINDSVIPDLLECIIKILNEKFGIDIDLKIITDEKGNRQVSYKGKNKNGSNVPGTIVTEENPGTGWDLTFGNTTG